MVLEAGNVCTSPHSPRLSMTQGGAGGGRQLRHLVPRNGFYEIHESFCNCPAAPQSGYSNRKGVLAWTKRGLGEEQVA